jgi:hypothetical protein
MIAVNLHHALLKRPPVSLFCLLSTCSPLPPSLHPTQVYVSKQEVDQVKTSAQPDPGLVLLGFKPMTALKDFHQLRNSTFLYPGTWRRPCLLHSACCLQQLGNAVVTAGACGHCCSWIKCTVSLWESSEKGSCVGEMRARLGCRQ